MPGTSRLIIVLGSTVACAAHGPPASVPPHLLVRPPCTSPVPVLERYDRRAPGYVVVLNTDLNAPSEAELLSNRYPMQVRWIFENTPAFTAEFPPFVLAALRCDLAVTKIRYNQLESAEVEIRVRPPPYRDTTSAGPALNFRSWDQLAQDPSDSLRIWTYGLEIAFGGIAVTREGGYIGARLAVRDSLIFLTIAESYSSGGAPAADALRPLQWAAWIGPLAPGSYQLVILDEAWTGVRRERGRWPVHITRPKPVQHSYGRGGA